MDRVGTTRVRGADTDDLDAILAIHHRAAANETAGAATDRERRMWQRMMATDDLVVYCAELDGEVVGTATMMTMPNITYGCAPTAFVEAVVTAPEHRRKGVATAVLEQALADAAAAGCNKVQLLSHKRHAADGAHKLYTRLGFVPEAVAFRLYLGEIPEAVAAARGDSL